METKKPVKKRGLGIYMQNILQRKIQIPFTKVGSNISEIIEEKLIEQFSGICIKEGFVKENSIRLLNNSSGTLNGAFVDFNTNFECLLCKPVEGMKLHAVVKNVTKAGLRCEAKGDASPFIAFVARDHHFQSKDFASVKVDDEIMIKVIGIRYELYDKYISIIGQFIPNKKPRIVINKKT